MIGRLDAEGLGRAIMTSHRDSEKTAVRQTDTGFDIERQGGEKRDELVGYELPLKGDDSQHLILFKDGTMLVLEPSGTYIEDYYKEMHSANPNPIVYYEQTLPQVIDKYKSPIGGSKVVSANDRETSAEQFNSYFDQALQVASTRKAEREQAHRSTMSSFVDKFGAFFRRGEGTPSVQPPNEPPSLQPPQGE